MRNLGIPGLAALSFVLALPAIPAFAAETYYTDQGHTEVRLGWNHAGVSMQSAEFTTVKGELNLEPEDVEDSTLNVTIDTASISTGFGPLDDHLKSKDFLEVETYPQITFTSTGVKRTGDNTAEVTGDLTIHGVTKPVTLKTTLTHRGDHPLGAFIDYYKGKWIAFSAATEIDHVAFDVGNKFPTGPISISIITEMKDRE
ncbi:MAG: polyisoprenoid-binding protein [Hyphomicrobiales bacterium]|nr:polyisoprenoid-binding protein [Hyphomicrobiales bacterium]MCP4997540.1 polyisoprenoid-binding protein [Hyphomicrobiales bacterium]